MRKWGDGYMNDCKNCDNSQACVPFFLHENAMMHYNTANRRMLIALITICIAFVVTITVFVCSYNARTENWLKTLQAMNPHITEVASGVQQQSD